MENIIKNIMSYKVVKNYKTVVFNSLLFVLLFTWLYLIKNTFLRLIGITCIMLLFLIIISDVVWRIDKIKFNKTWLWFMALVLYNSIMMVRTPTVKSLYAYLLQMALLLIVTLSTSISLSEEELKKVFRYGRVICCIILIPAIVIALEGGRAAFWKFNFILNPTIYKIILPCTFFFIAGYKYKGLKVLVFALIYLRMVERTAFIVLVGIYIVYLILKHFKVSRSFYRFILVATFFLMIGFVYVYVESQYTALGPKLNALSRQYTGGNFYSGRNTIWRTAFSYIKQAPIIGHGLDNRVMELAGVNMSTHNTYIHILLQGGLLGLSIFFMFMYSIWEKLYDYLANDIVRTSAAYLIGFLVYINFEVTLIGNSVVISIFMWLVIGIGAIKCNNIKRSIEDSKEAIL